MGALRLLAAPLAVGAQQAAGKLYRIGFLATLGSGGADLRRILPDGLREHGYVEGRNLEILVRHGDGGIDLLPEAAAELVRRNAEVVAFQRFTHPRELMAYLGLVPSEHSSGDRERSGAITKAGNTHARRVLVEAAWHYRHRPTLSRALAARAHGQPTACRTQA